MDQPNPEKEPQSKTESRPEASETRPEAKIEASAEQYTQGAQMLEEPKSGSFVSALQAFVAWVKSLTE